MHVRPGKWPELEALDKKYTAVEERLGFPPKRQYKCYFGAHDTNTYISECEWESLSAMEAAFAKAFADPEWLSLGEGFSAVIESDQEEIYATWP